MRIEKIPLNFDASIAEMYHPLLHPNNMLDTHFVKNNFDAYKQLKKYRLVIENDNGKLGHSALGSIFFNYIEEQNELGHKDLMSFVVEYKIMELRSRITYIANNEAYIWVNHSVDFFRQNGSKETEIDLMLQNKERKKCIAVEVKSSGQLQKVKTQITKQIQALKRESSIYGELKEFHLIIYDVVEPNSSIKKQRNPNLLNNLKEIKSKVPNEIIFKVWDYQLLKKVREWHYNKDKNIKTPKNPYQDFMQEKIELNDLKFINII